MDSKATAAAAAQQTAATNTKKSAKSAFRILTKTQDARCGILQGVVMYVMDPSRKKKDSMNPAPLSAVPNMAGMPSVGVTGKAPSHTLLVAIVDIDNVDIQSYTGCYENQEDSVGTQIPLPLFEKNYDGTLSVRYSMSCEDTPGSKAKKIWTETELNDKVKFDARAGDLFWTNVWASGTQFAIGAMVKLTNVKLVRKDGNWGPSGHIAVAQRPVFATYFFNCDVNLVDNHPIATYPMHTKLRALWPPCEQFIPSAQEIAEMYCQREDSVNNYTMQSAQNIVKRITLANSDRQRTNLKTPTLMNPSESTEQPGVFIDDLQPRHLHQKKFMHTHLLVIDSNINNMVPCCDEYDPEYTELLKSVESASNPESVAEVEELSKQFDNQQCRKELDLLTKAGQITQLQWPTNVDEIFKKPDDGSEPYLRWEVCTSIISWGYRGCHTDKNYKSPLSSHCDVNLQSGLVVVTDHSDSIDCGGGGGDGGDGATDPKYYKYQFRRVLALFKLYTNNLDLGPTNPEDLAELIISHQIPCDIIIDVDLTKSADLERVRKEITIHNQIKALSTSYDAEKTALTARSKASELETSRWMPLTKEESLELMESEEPAKVDEAGIMLCNVQTVAWRLGEYLINGGGILLTPEEMPAIYKTLSDNLTPEDGVSTLHPMCVPNIEGVVYLNPLKTGLQRLGADYAFYALVCLGSTLGKNEHARKINRTKLENIIKLSKAGTSETRKTQSSAIVEYLSNTTARIFYYAVNTRIYDRCRKAAKDRHSKLVDKYTLQTDSSTEDPLANPAVITTVNCDVQGNPETTTVGTSTTNVLNDDTAETDNVAGNNVLDKPSLKRKANAMGDETVTTTTATLTNNKKHRHQTGKIPRI